MKIILSLFAGFILIAFTSNFTKPETSTGNEDKVEVFFSNKLDFNDLVKMKLDLSQKQIILNYQTLEFDDKYKLKSISFNVISEGKYCGSGRTEMLSKHDYGFSIDRSPNARVYFQVGLTR